jgi:ribose-phosphate pyrophosphokinase
MTRKVLFHAPGMETMAAEIARVAKLDRGVIRWGSFADGTPDNFIHDVDRHVKDRHVVFLANVEDITKAFSQLSVVYAFHPYGAASLTVVIPFFSVATSDRIIDQGDIVAAKTLVRMLDATDRPMRVIILDPHDVHLFHYFKQSQPEFLSAMPMLLHGIMDPRPEEGNIPRKVCFPDEGARKRYGRHLPDAIVCAKVRNGTTPKVTVIDGDPRGCHVTVVDDMIQKGGTMAECAKALTALGAVSVGLRAVHGVLPHPSVSILGTARAKEIVVTDSLPTKSRTALFLPGSEVCSVAVLLAQALS